MMTCLNLERGFRRITFVVSLAVLGLACRLIAWPAVVNVLDALSWVKLPHRFVVQTNAGPYLVGSTRAMTNDQLRLLFLREEIDPNGDERINLLHVDLATTAREFVGRSDSWDDLLKIPRGHAIISPPRPVWWGISVFLLPYLVGTIGLAFIPWGVFYLVRWIVRGFKE